MERDSACRACRSQLVGRLPTRATVPPPTPPPYNKPPSNDFSKTNPFVFVFDQSRFLVETQVADYGGLEAREGSLPGAGDEAGPLLGLDEPLVALAPRKKKTRSTAVRSMRESLRLSSDPLQGGSLG